MLALTKASFLQLRPQEVIIRWGTTKSTRLTPFAPTLWTVVEDPDPQRLMPLIHHVNQLPRPDSPFTTLTSHDFCRMASRLKVKWTAHSMKRGAVTHLIEQAAEGSFRKRRSGTQQTTRRQPGCWARRTRLDCFRLAQVRDRPARRRQ
jgi:hypothetical protein